MPQASEPRSVWFRPNSLLSSTRTPVVRKSRSKNLSCSWKNPEFVSLAALNGVPRLRPLSRRSSRPNEIVDHLPAWKWLTHSTFFCTSLQHPEDSHEMQKDAPTVHTFP